MEKRQRQIAAGAVAKLQEILLPCHSDGVLFTLSESDAKPFLQ